MTTAATIQEAVEEMMAYRQTLRGRVKKLDSTLSDEEVEVRALRLLGSRPAVYPYRAAQVQS